MSETAAPAPAHKVEWDVNENAWHTGPLLGFDTETTGVDPRKDRIVTAAIVSGEDVSRWLLDPGVHIPEAAQAVHGISTEHAQEHGLAPGEALPEIAAALTKAAEESIPVVAYRAPFDLTLLASELDRHGLGQVPWSDLLVIDPYVLDKRCDKWRKGKRTLTAVTAHYGVTLDEAHTAAADARAAVAVARAIGAKYPRVAQLSPAELHTNQVAWHAEDAASLEAYFRRQGRQEAVDQRWPLQR